jgi:hypothetical protein
MKIVVCGLPNLAQIFEWVVVANNIISPYPQLSEVRVTYEGVPSVVRDAPTQRCAGAQIWAAK